MRNQVYYGRLSRRFVFVLLSLWLASSVLLLAGGGSVYNPRSGRTYDDLQEAIYDAYAGDTLYVSPGAYERTFIIRDSLTLRGVKKDGASPRIVPGKDTSAFVIINPPRGSEVTIEGFDIELDTYLEGVLSEVAFLTLINNRFTNSGQSLAVKTYMPAGVAILGNSFANFRRAISLENDPDYPVSDVLIAGNEFTNILEPMVLTAAPGAVIADNTMQNDYNPDRYNRSSGITLHDSPGAQVTGNSICTHHFGIYIIGGDATYIADNRIIRDMETSGSGIYVAVSSDAVIARNRVEEVDYAITLDLTINSTVFENWMERSVYGLHNSPPPNPNYLVDARNNWWGSPDGPSFQGSGHGVPVNENVLFEPWLELDPKIEPAKCQ